jgi:hypothetical protein
VLSSLDVVAVRDRTPPVVDPALPTLAAALDPERAQAALARLPALAGAGPLTSIRVVRHKPGRRCLLAYDLAGYGTVLGKVQRHRYGKSGYRLLAALRAAGFDGGEDGIAVPEPLGVIGEFRMWLQREVPGRPATEAIGDSGAERLAQRVSEAAHKLHTAGVPAERRHTAEDEVRILHQCLGRVAAADDRLARRIGRLLHACERAAGTLAGAPTCGIHRDFYSDQVLVDGERLTLVDFDLYCLGDPALDIGNYLGHVTEQALRVSGSESTFASFEQELSEDYARRAGAGACARLRTWAALTLARHVYLSTRFEERRHVTLPLLELAERRLAEATS